jgi:stage II sporulation protein R
MPAGRYTAVKVVIGEGAGHNWWCVMFPPLCLPAAQDRGGNIDAFLDGDELKVVESSGRYEPRFKIVEIIEELREKTSPENFLCGSPIPKVSRKIFAERVFFCQIC